MDKKAVIEELQRIKETHGEWASDIPLTEDIWTRGNIQIPQTRLRRVIQIAADLSGKPLSECRALDLGCLDGIFSLEFALQGAETVGIEVRDENIEKALFSKKVLGLTNVNFIKGDARDISVEANGLFDIILCSGLLYHLTAPDAIKLISKMHEMTKRLLIIDTHIALKPEISYKHNSTEYWGKTFFEHNKNDTQEVKSKRKLASWDNITSFWFTRPSLINLLNHTGFSSVYECFNPPHLNFGKGGVEHIDRCTFVAVKGERSILKASPAVNKLNEDWPEGTLGYCNKNNSILKRIISKTKRSVMKK